SDVLLLARYFMERACSELGVTPIAFTPAAERALTAYHWPGNVRELENLMERSAVLASGDLLDSTDLPEYMTQQSAGCTVIEIGDEMPPEGIDFNGLVDSFETKLISMALSKTGGNKKAAARLLRLNRTTLVEKIRKKGLESKIEVLVEPNPVDVLSS
ncbi:MAG: sigma-54-dependent Fis family transcriptional regulator, partial [Deltaproteobacteria bacterium]|nr:sigma-54-dependent Fis family transcriptional regulator [Deltaproteobacteria bacterium]